MKCFRCQFRQIQHAAYLWWCINPFDANIVEAADSYGCTIFCFPSNTTHELQPFDKSVFGPYELWSTQKAIERRTINYRLFAKVWLKAVRKQSDPSYLSSTSDYYTIHNESINLSYESRNDRHKLETSF